MYAYLLLLPHTCCEHVSLIIAINCYIVDLKKANVNSTKEILKLCIESRPKALNYVSTIGVFAAFPGKTISEESTPSKSR